MVDFVAPQARLLLVLMFEIQVPFIFLQPKILIELVSHAISTSRHNCCHRNRCYRFRGFSLVLHDSHSQSVRELTNILHLVTFSSLLLLSCKCKRFEKNSAIRPWQDNNQERTTRLTQARPHMAQLTCELQQDFCSVPIYNPSIAKNPQKTPITVSLFDHIEAAMRYCILHRLHPIF
jgi:hypothetical protein